MNSRRNFLRTASGAVGGFIFATATEASAKTRTATAKERLVTILNGRGAPSKRRGIVGDFYIDTRSHSLYGPKRASGWGRPTKLVGPAGRRGPAGSAGSAGGASGTLPYMILNGSGPPPAGMGVDNDYYIDTSTTQLYGPKRSGVWGSPVSLTGDANHMVNNDGLVGATLADLSLVTSANTGYSQNTGVLIMNACRVNAPATRMAFEVDAQGSGLIAGQNFIGIYDTSGNLVMASGDLTTIWSTAGTVDVIVVNLPSTLEAGLYHVGVLMNYTGSSGHPYLTGAYCPMIPEIGTKFSGVPRVCYGTKSYATLPSSVNWASDGFTANPWFFVTFIGFLP